MPFYVVRRYHVGSSSLATATNGGTTNFEINSLKFYHFKVLVGIPKLSSNFCINSYIM